MKLSPAAFKNPINQTKSTDAADAFDKPILTLNSLRRGTNNVQTNGLPTDNKTTLGLYRFPGGDIGPLDGGIGQPAVPPVAPILKFPSVSFVSIGNNVAQPDSDSASLATNALLKRLGEQKFKAKENEPYAAYVAQMKLERDVAEAEKTASVADLNLAREILRSAMAERRKQNEDDYLRKMLDSGMSVEDAKDELDEVRRANALQESRKVEDRSYQSKLLLVNLAKARGIPSTVNEPLTQSGPIMNPAPNDMLATAAGNPGDGFGNSPLDVNRLFLTPDYYKTFLRKGRITDEEMDRQAALNNMIASGTTDSIQTPLQLDARRRQLAIENSADNLANILSNIRSRAIMDILPPNFFATTIYPQILKTIGKAPLNKARMLDKSIENMTSAELIVAINRAFGINRQNIRAAIDFLRGRPYGSVSLKSLMVELLNHLNFTSIKTLLLTDIRIPPMNLQDAIIEFINSSADRIDEMYQMSFDYTNALEENAAQLFAEPKTSGKQSGDEKKNLYFNSVGAAPTPVEQITKKYGLLPSSARRIVNVIGEARERQLDARTIAEQEQLSKQRAVQIMRDFKNKQKASREEERTGIVQDLNQREAELKSTGAPTRAMRRPRTGGVVSLNFTPGERQINERDVAIRASMVKDIPKTASAWDKLTSGQKDTIASKYGISSSLSRKQQYEQLKNLI